jgi:hypothetical protein
VNNASVRAFAERSAILRRRKNRSPRSNVAEGRLSGDESPSNRQRTVAQAAAELGMTEGAIRGRIKRGTLRAHREGGRVYVVVESSARRDEPPDEPSDQSELIAVLREQLAAERQAHAEARRIIAGLVERIPAIEAPESPETPSEPVQRGTGTPRRDGHRERPVVA